MSAVELSYIMFLLDLTITEETHCRQLYCWDDVTLLLKTQPGAPALLGTRCDREKVCYKGRCQDKNTVGATTTKRPLPNPSTIPGVIQNICHSINTFVLSLGAIFG